MRLALLSLVLLAGCAPKSLSARVAALEARNTDLERRVAQLEAGGTGTDPRIAAADLEQEARQFQAELSTLIAQGNPDGARRRCAEQGDRYTSARAAGAIRRTCSELAVVGKAAMPFEVDSWYQGGAPDLNGDVLVVFLEEWCPHCRREVPKLQMTADRWAGRMDVVGVTKLSRSSTEDKVRAFVADNGVTYAIGKETDGRMSDYYAVTGIPAAVILHDGKVAWRGHPGRLDDAMIEGLLAK